MDTPDQTHLADAEFHRLQVVELRAAMDASDDVPAYVMLYRAQRLSELRDLDLRVGLHIEQAQADISDAREMMRHVEEHGAVPTRRLESLLGSRVQLSVLGRAPGDLWWGRVTLTDIQTEQVDDPLLSGPAQASARVRLTTGGASTWVWADRIWDLTHPVQTHPLEEALDRVPTPAWLGAQDAFIATRAVATYALGYEVEYVRRAPGDGRLPPGVLGTIASQVDQDVQLSAVIVSAGSLRMQHHLAQAGQGNLVLAGVEALSGCPWRHIDEYLPADGFVWWSRALSDAQRLVELPEVVRAIEALTAAMQDGPVDGATVEQVAGPARAAVRELQVWVPESPQEASDSE
ncbi:hypothetical protein AB0M72_06860 [Nocardiopsis dassonvillei]